MHKCYQNGVNNVYINNKTSSNTLLSVLSSGRDREPETFHILQNYQTIDSTVHSEITNINCTVVLLSHGPIMCA